LPGNTSCTGSRPVNAADHGELYPAIVHIKEVGDAGSRCDSVELHAGIALLPDAHPLIAPATVFWSNRSIAIPHNPLTVEP
jgi:hypothetical protein